MSDETDFSDDGLDDRIRRSMSGLGAGAAQVARPATGADIRRRAGRRRQVLVAGTLSAALIVGAGAIVAGNVFDSPGTLVVPQDSSPATTEPTAESTAEPTAEPTVSPPPASHSEPPPTSAPTTEAPVVEPPPTRIPEGFTLPHEGETSDDSYYSDWKTVDELATPWDLSVCGVGLFDGDEARTDFRKVSQTGPEWYDSSAIAVYADADVAVGVMADMRAAVEGCVEAPTGEPADIQSWDLREVEVGGEAFVAASSVTGPDGNPRIGGANYAVTRLGSAIYLTTAGGESFPSVDDEWSQMLVERLQDFVPTMCVFTVAGC